MLSNHSGKLLRNQALLVSLESASLSSSSSSSHLSTNNIITNGGCDSVIQQALKHPQDISDNHHHHHHHHHQQHHHQHHHNHQQHHQPQKRLNDDDDDDDDEKDNNNNNNNNNVKSHRVADVINRHFDDTTLTLLTASISNGFSEQPRINVRSGDVGDGGGGDGKYLIDQNDTLKLLSSLSSSSSSSSASSSSLSASSSSLSSSMKSIGRPLTTTTTTTTHDKADKQQHRNEQPQPQPQSHHTHAVSLLDVGANQTNALYVVDACAKLTDVRDTQNHQFSLHSNSNNHHNNHHHHHYNANSIHVQQQHKLAAEPNSNISQYTASTNSAAAAAAAAATADMPQLKKAAIFDSNCVSYPLVSASIIAHENSQHHAINVASSSLSSASGSTLSDNYFNLFGNSAAITANHSGSSPTAESGNILNGSISNSINPFGNGDISGNHSLPLSSDHQTATNAASAAILAAQPPQSQSQPQPPAPHSTRGRKRSKKGPFICPECRKEFSNQSTLTKHMITHSDERKFVCQQCSKAFKRHDHLNGHMLTHREHKPYACDIDGCDKSYCDARSLRRHKEKHREGIIQCNGEGLLLSQKLPGSTPETTSTTTIVADKGGSNIVPTNNVYHHSHHQQQQQQQQHHNHLSVNASAQLQYLALQQQQQQKVTTHQGDSDNFVGNAASASSSSSSSSTSHHAHHYHHAHHNLNHQSKLTYIDKHHAAIGAIDATSSSSSAPLSLKSEDEDGQQEQQQQQQQLQHRRMLVAAAAAAAAAANSQFPSQPPPPSNFVNDNALLHQLLTTNSAAAAAAVAAVNSATHERERTLSPPPSSSSSSSSMFRPNSHSNSNSTVIKLTDGFNLNLANDLIGQISASSLQNLSSSAATTQQQQQSLSQNGDKESMMAPFVNAMSDKRHRTDAVPSIDDVTDDLPPPHDNGDVECQVCQRRFKNIASLNGHMRLHGGFFAMDYLLNAPSSSSSLSKTDLDSDEMSACKIDSTGYLLPDYSLAARAVPVSAATASNKLQFDNLVKDCIIYGGVGAESIHNATGSHLSSKTKNEFNELHLFAAAAAAAQQKNQNDINTYHTNLRLNNEGSSGIGGAEPQFKIPLQQPQQHYEQQQQHQQHLQSNNIVGTTKIDNQYSMQLDRSQSQPKQVQAPPQPRPPAPRQTINDMMFSPITPVTPLSKNNSQFIFDFSHVQNNNNNANNAIANHNNSNNNVGGKNNNNNNNDNNVPILVNKLSNDNMAMKHSEVLHYTGTIDTNRTASATAVSVNDVVTSDDVDPYCFDSESSSVTKNDTDHLLTSMKASTNILGPPVIGQSSNIENISENINDSHRHFAAEMNTQIGTVEVSDEMKSMQSIDETNTTTNVTNIVDNNNTNTNDDVDQQEAANFDHFDLPSGKLTSDLYNRRIRSKHSKSMIDDDSNQIRELQIKEIAARLQSIGQSYERNHANNNNNNNNNNCHQNHYNSHHHHHNNHQYQQSMSYSVPTTPLIMGSGGGYEQNSYHLDHHHHNHHAHHMSHHSLPTTPIDTTHFNFNIQHSAVDGQVMSPCPPHPIASSCTSLPSTPIEQHQFTFHTANDSTITPTEMHATSTEQVSHPNAAFDLSCLQEAQYTAEDFIETGFIDDESDIGQNGNDDNGGSNRTETTENDMIAQFESNAIENANDVVSIVSLVPERTQQQPQQQHCEARPDNSATTNLNNNFTDNNCDNSPNNDIIYSRSIHDHHHHQQQQQQQQHNSFILSTSSFNCDGQNLPASNRLTMNDRLQNKENTIVLSPMFTPAIDNDDPPRVTINHIDQDDDSIQILSHSKDISPISPQSESKLLTFDPLHSDHHQNIGATTELQQLEMVKDINSNYIIDHHDEIATHKVPYNIEVVIEMSQPIKQEQMRAEDLQQQSQHLLPPPPPPPLPLPGSDKHNNEKSNYISHHSHHQHQNQKRQQSLHKSVIKTASPHKASLSTKTKSSVESIGSNIGASTVTASSNKKKHRPAPLYIPPHVNTFVYHSRLRSPCFWNSSGNANTTSGIGFGIAAEKQASESTKTSGKSGTSCGVTEVTRKQHITPPPYTPPPMLSPVRSGPGLFWKLNNLALNCKYSSSTSSSSSSLSGDSKIANFATKKCKTGISTVKKSAATINSSQESNTTKIDAIVPEILPREDAPTSNNSNNSELRTPTTAYEPLIYDYEIPQTDVQPHVNIGPNFQARIPAFNARNHEAVRRKADKDDLVWHPRSLTNVSDEHLRLYTRISCSMCVPGAGNNMEYALHLLHQCGGDVLDALSRLVKPNPAIEPQHPLSDYRYADNQSWESSEISSFQESLLKNDKDFFLISHEVKTKSVKQCIEFYYLWKKSFPDIIKRLRFLRRKRESMFYNLSTRSETANYRHATLPSSPQPLRSDASDQSKSGINATTGGDDKRSSSSSSTSSSETSSASSINGGSNYNSNDRKHHFNDQRQSNRAHGSGGGYPCSKCRKTFKKLRSRSAHMKIHGND